MPNPFFAPGPTPGTVINSPGELDALVADASPDGNHGLTYRATTAPDIATYPIYANFIWIDTSGPRVVKRTYNTTLFTWDAESPANGSITGDMIADDTITIAKLHPPSGVGGYVVRVNSGSTAFILDDPLNLFAANTLPVSYLEYSTVGKFVLGSTGAANAWDTVNNLTDDGSLALAKLSTTGASATTVLGGSPLARGTVNSFIATGGLDITKLALGGPNTFLGTDGAGTARVDFTVSQIANLLSGYFTGAMLNSGNQSVPGGGAILTYAHGLGVRPSNMYVVLVCISTDANYAPLDELNLASLYTESGGGSNQPPFAIWADGTNINLRGNADAGGNYSILNASTGSPTLIDNTKWRVKIYYQR